MEIKFFEFLKFYEFGEFLGKRDSQRFIKILKYLFSPEKYPKSQQNIHEMKKKIKNAEKDG